MTTWAREPRALWRRSGDRVILAPPGCDDRLLLEGTAAITWLLLDEPVDHDRLVTQLRDTFDGDPSTIDVEVAAFLDGLAAIDAVVRS